MVSFLPWSDVNAEVAFVLSWLVIVFGVRNGCRYTGAQFDVATRPEIFDLFCLVLSAYAADHKGAARSCRLIHYAGGRALQLSCPT